MSNVKDSALPVSTTMDNADKFRALIGGVSKSIALSSLKSVLSFQPLNGNLTTLAGAAAPSSMGLGFLSATTPTVASYALIGPANTVSYQTALQVVAYLRANGLGVDTTTAQLLINKIINGLTLAVGTAATPQDTVTTVDTPSDTFLLRIVKMGFTGGSINFRFTKPTVDVTFPDTGVLATVAGVRGTSDDSKASATTLNLDTVDGSQVDVTGTNTITAITLADGSERIVKFTGILTLTQGASLLLPGGKSITTAAGDYATFKGGAAGVVTCIDYFRANTSYIANINGGLIQNANYRLKSYTAAGLPSSPVVGDTALVTDASSASYGGIVAGGGFEVTPVFYNGSNWIMF